MVCYFYVFVKDRSVEIHQKVVFITILPLLGILPFTRQTAGMMFRKEIEILLKLITILNIDTHQYYNYSFLYQSRARSTIEFLNVIGDKNDTPAHHQQLFSTPSRNVMISEESCSEHQNQGLYQINNQSMTLPGMFTSYYFI